MTSFIHDGATDWLDRRARLSPDRVGLVEGIDGRRVTFAEWNARVNRTANLLRALGVGRGDRVSVYASNRPEYLDLFWAAGKIGAILHNLNWRLTVHELSGIVADAEPTVFVYGGDWRTGTDDLRDSMPTVRHVVALDEPARDDLPFSERDGQPDVLGARPDLTLEDPWAIFYTGGTTGLPKGAVLTHGNISWNSVNTVVSWGLTADHIAPLQLPLFHIGGPNIFMAPLVHVGGTTILCRGFDVDETFDLVERGGITHYVGVPTMFQMLQRHPRWEEVDFGRLRLVISGGAPCPLPVMERFWDRGVDFKMGYGLTEATGNNFWLPPERIRDKGTSVGQPLFHIDAKVVDDEGGECPAGEVGELWLRGPHVMSGYWRRPEETEAVLADGWLRTGDLAVVDDEGFFTIRGRSKDMFISGGENVYPAEVESVMLSHPAVVEAALVAVPDETWGEAGRACLTVTSAFDEAEFLRFLRERLAGYKIPRECVYLDELPKTAIGKIDKKKLAGGSS